MKIEIDPSRCCAAGLCAAVAPEVFDQDDTDGTVVLLDSTPSDELGAAVLEAAATCPGGVIRVVS